MLNVTDGFKEAIIGVSRRMLAKAVVEIIDPDITYSESTGSGAAPWSKPRQLHDKTLALAPRYGTLEPGRWPLDGTVVLLPDDPATATGQTAHAGDVLCDESGVFSTEVYAEQPFSNVSILQACSVYFSTDPIDGIPVDFRVSVMSGDTAVYTKEFTGNTATSVSLTDFTVYDPTSIRVYVTRWSTGRRRIRIVDIIPGLFEEWDLSSIVSLDIQMRGNFADLALPYGTANLRIKNTDRRFEPFTRSGIFRSIEERQSIPISMGPVMPDGSVEFAPVGVFYQRSGGWDTGKNDMYIDWSLVDICGLLADRDFQIPATLPTTLAGWFRCFAEQLGSNFSDMWHVDPDYADLPVTVNDRAHLQNRKCGALIRFACMATGTWPRADQATGKLTAEPLWSQGSKITLAQMYDYPTKKANDQLATLTFKLYDGTESGTLTVISGNSTSSSKNLSIDNPFIHTEAAAQTAARQILSQYGGIKIEAESRGNPASEIGDVDTIWINQSEAKTGRRMEQSFRITNGVLKHNRNVWLQADGSFLFEERRVLTGEGSFHVPAGVTQLRLLIVGGGQGGMRGEDGKYNAESAAGTPGHGGYIWSGVVNVNPDTDYAFSCGKGGKASTAFGTPGAEGGHTTFGVHTSANGAVYAPSYTDLASGSAYGRPGVAKPVGGTGDGGAGGEAGSPGVSYRESVYWTQADVDAGKHPGYTTGPDGGNRPTSNPNETSTTTSIVGKQKGWQTVRVKEPTPGKPGADGADGCVVIYWDKEAEA